MFKNKRFGLIAGIILAVTCLFASAATVVSAETPVYDKTKTDIEQTYNDHKALFDGSSFLGEESEAVYENFYKEAYDFAGTSSEIDYQKWYVLEHTGELAREWNYANLYIFGVLETGSVDEAKKIADEFRKTYKMTQDDLSYNKFLAKEEELNGILKKYKADLEDIRIRDAKNYEDYKQTAVDEVAKTYDELSAVTKSSNDTKGNRVYGSYSAEQYQKLNSVFEKYVTRADGASDSPAAFGALDVAYSVEEVADRRAEIEQAKNDAIAELKSVKRNVLEKVYDDYNDYLYFKNKVDAISAVDPDSDELTLAKNELNKCAELLKGGAVDEALAFYNGASEDVKKKYSEKAKSLSDFAYEYPDVIIAEYVSSLKDEYNAVKVTAYYVNDAGTSMREAKVFPSAKDGGKLEVYANANGSAKKTASNLIKEENKNVSVAYMINFTVYQGTRVFEVPSSLDKVDADGNAVTDGGTVSTEDVCYRIEIDLNKYYEYYCEPRGYEKNKLANVENAFAAINGGDGALCYVYSDGAIEKAYVADNKQTELSGGRLVFYTRSFANFCITGTGLENWLTNPWTYVILLAVLIVLIFIIKLIVKHCKYTIKFITNGGSRVHSIRVAKNEAIVLPDSPVKTGLVFGGWYVDSDCTVRFIETKLRRRRGYKLYAKWSAPVSAEVLTSFYDGLRTLMASYEKRSFKPTLGLVEKDLIANMFGKENYIVLYLDVKPEKAAEVIGETAPLAHKDKKFASLPTKYIISDARTYADALKLTEYAMRSKGLQIKDELPETVTSTVEERNNGFAYFVRNERVAATTADYFELLRLEVKSFVMESDNGKFKPGDRFTFARMYYDAKSVDLYLPTVKGIKELEKGSRSPRFGDTPVHIVICDGSDLEKAFALVERAMVDYGFTKHPENCNDLEDLVLAETNGFAYTIRF